MRERRVAFAAGLALVAVALLPPLHDLSFESLTMHLLQNVMLAEWAPALLVLGIPPALAARLGRIGVVRELTRPWIALPLWLATYFAWHVPAAYDAALRNDALLHVEHVTYVIAGLLLWWWVFHDAPRQPSHGARALYLFVAFVLASPIGLLLALLPDPVYAYYEPGTGLWGLEPLADQQAAGVLMAVAEAAVFFTAFAVYVFRLMSAEERAAIEWERLRT
jgi:cytochrome c oxidase assembly factor CtaG